MPKHRIAIIPGDGIGPEIMKATLGILDAGGFDAEYTYFEAGLPALEKGMDAVPLATIEGVRSIGISLKGPTTTPSGGGHVSANVTLRKALDLFANVRPTKTFPGLKGPFADKNIDIIIVREN